MNVICCRVEALVFDRFSVQSDNIIYYSHVMSSDINSIKCSSQWSKTNNPSTLYPKISFAPLVYLIFFGNLFL